MDKEEILREAAEENLVRESSQRRFLYRDVEELIESGFLTHTLNIEGFSLTLRTLLPKDLVRLKARSRIVKEDYEIARWSIASSVWMIDGFEVSLNDSDNGAYHVHREWAKDLNSSMVEVLASMVVGLRNRLMRAIRLTEAFCYEPYSRGSWRMLGKPSVGLENSSVVRRLWVAHNLSEDNSQEESRQWVHTRAIVSSMGGSKGAKQLATALQQGEDKEEQRRQKVIEEAVNWIIQGEREDQKPLVVTIDGKTVVVPKVHTQSTTSELEEEMRRVFSGEKDFHDMIVDQYHQRIRGSVEDRRESFKNKILEARQRADAAAEANPSASVVGYTREQLMELNPEILKNKTTSNISDGAQANYIYDRYFGPQLKPGVLTPSMRVEDADPTRDKFAQVKRDEDQELEPSLQERISKRKTQIS